MEDKYQLGDKIHKPEKHDPIVENIRNKFLQRSQLGIKKYGTTLSENKKDNFLNHLLEELFDACNYIETLLHQNEDITQIVKTTENDQELGQKIREIYGK